MHKFECPLIVEFGRPVGDVPALLLRTALIVGRKPESLHWKFEKHDGEMRTLDDLLSHSDDIRRDTDYMEDFNLIADTFVKANIVYNDDSDDHPKFAISRDQLLELYGKLLVNAFGILDCATFTPVGSGLYIETSVFDHSCSVSKGTRKCSE